MLDIYKKLPGTNCGKCGAATCMAFAMKVKRSQASLRDCPFTKNGTSNETKSQPAAKAFSNYEQVSNDLEKEAVKNDFSGLKRRCAEMGGAEIEGRIKADYTCRIDLLPRVPLYLSFWQADEEFDPDCKIVFDSGAEDHIDIEYLAYLLELFVEELTGEPPRKGT